MRGWKRRAPGRPTLRRSRRLHRRADQRFSRYRQCRRAALYPASRRPAGFLTCSMTRRSPSRISPATGSTSRSAISPKTQGLSVPDRLCAPAARQNLGRGARRRRRCRAYGKLMPKGYKARPEQAILFTVSAWDANCPQHIPQRFEAARYRARPAHRRTRSRTRPIARTGIVETLGDICEFGTDQRPWLCSGDEQRGNQAMSPSGH